MTTEHRHPRCITPVLGTPTDATVIAELRREVGDLKLQREADVAEAAVTYEAMRAEVRDLEVSLEWERNEAQRANDTTDYVLAERDAEIAELEKLVDELRCGDLGPFFAGRLSTERADAFRLHLATCKACDEGLLSLASEHATTNAP